MIDESLDAKGLNCPLPILKTKKSLNSLDVGSILEVFATDPGSVDDFESFCRNAGHELIEQSEDEAVFRFVIKKCK